MYFQNYFLTYKEDPGFGDIISIVDLQYSLYKECILLDINIVLGALAIDSTDNEVIYYYRVDEKKYKIKADYIVITCQTCGGTSRDRSGNRLFTNCNKEDNSIDGLYCYRNLMPK